MAIRTIVLKIYKPSTKKKQILDEAMLNYTLAYQYLLDTAQSEMEEIKVNYMDKNGKYSAKRISKWIGSNFNFVLNKFSIEPFKDSLKIDFGSTIAGYLNRLATGELSEYPSSYINEEMFNNEYNKVMNRYINYDEDAEETLKKVNKLVSKNGNLRPIFFCRYATNRNYCILYNGLKDRYYIKMYLMNSHNENRKKYNENSTTVLKYISKNRDTFKVHGKAEGFLILPVSFGKFQEKYLKLVFKKPEIIKTARLVKRKDEYYLSVNIEIEEMETIEVTNYMGVSRGITNIVNYTIVNKIDDTQVYGNEKSDGNSIKLSKLHEIANRLIKLAKNNNCQMIMEKLIDKGDKLNWIDKNGKSYNSILGCFEYNRLYDILKYKLPANGLPSPIRVSSLGIFYTCPRCASNTKRNRFSDSVFMCTSCGMSLSIEKVGSNNISRKLIKYGNDTVKLKLKDTTKGVRYINRELGIEFSPMGNYGDDDKLRRTINEVINDFYKNMDSEMREKTFKKKYSLIKKLETNDDVLKIIKIV